MLSRVGGLQHLPLVFSQPTEAPSWTDETVLNKIEDATHLEASPDEHSKKTIWKLDDHTVYKSIFEIDSDDDLDSEIVERESVEREVLAMLCVQAYTTIPVPRLHTRVFQNEYTYAVMDFIQGERLDVLWPTLSLWRKLGIAWTLRSYVRQLRRVLADEKNLIPPGPIGHIPRRCQGRQFWQHGQGGSFPDREAFFEYVRDYTLGTGEVEGIPDARDDEYTNDPVVFTHNDLTMRNVLISQDGTVWLIDWASAGFYPLYFEHIAATLATVRGPKVPWLWKLCIPFITDPFFREARYLLWHRTH